MEKRFAYKFLKKLLKYVDSAQEFIAHLGVYGNNTQDLTARHFNSSGYLLLNMYLVLSIQRPWLQAAKQTGPLMNRKSSFLPKYGCNTNTAAVHI